VLPGELLDPPDEIRTVPAQEIFDGACCDNGQHAIRLIESPQFLDDRPCSFGLIVDKIIKLSECGKEMTGFRISFGSH